MAKEIWTFHVDQWEGREGDRGGGQGGRKWKMAFAIRSHREAGMGNGYIRVDIRVTGVAKKA